MQLWPACNWRFGKSLSLVKNLRVFASHEGVSGQLIFASLRDDMNVNHLALDIWKIESFSFSSWWFLTNPSAKICNRTQFLNISPGRDENTLQGTNISPKKSNFEDDFPFPKVAVS